MPLYKRPESEVWWADIRHAGKRVRVTTGELDKAKAQQRHNELQIELWQAVPIVDGHTWGEAVDLWCRAKVRSDAELYSLAKFASRYPDRGLAAVDRESVKEALSFCIAASTHERYRAMLLSILNLAKKEDWLDKVPDLHQREPDDEVSPQWLTAGEWARLHNELPPHLQPMASFAIESGLRKANVLQLRWRNVSLERRLAWVTAENAKGKKAIPVPLSDAAMKVLEGQVGAHDEFVFVYEGKPIKSVKTAFNKACVRAKLGTVTKTVDTVDGRRKVSQSYDGFTWHGFRHTWATWHVQNGTPLDVLQKLGAWADLKMVQKYAHHSAGYLAGFANNTARKKA